MTLLSGFNKMLNQFIYVLIYSMNIPEILILKGVNSNNTEVIYKEILLFFLSLTSST